MHLLALIAGHPGERIVANLRQHAPYRQITKCLAPITCRVMRVH